VELTVADLSFISLGIVLPRSSRAQRTTATCCRWSSRSSRSDAIALGSGGVVRDPAVRAQAVVDVARQAARLGWGVAGVARRPVAGPSGNVEVFLWLRRAALRNDQSVDETQIGPW